MQQYSVCYGQFKNGNEMDKTKHAFFDKHYSHVYNSSRGGGAKVTKSINEEVGINVEGGILRKNLRIR